MEHLYDALGSFSARGWPLLVNHLWQSTLFTLALLPALLLLRRSPARVRYALSLLASAKFLLPSALFFVLLVRLVPGLEGRMPTSSFLAFDLGRLLGLFRPAGGGASAAGYEGLYLGLTFVWFLGAAVLGALWWRRQRAFGRALVAARVVTEGPEAELLAGVRRRLGIRRPVALALLPGGAEPGVWRVRRPLVVLPEPMPRCLTAEELEAIFLHELIHVRRGDNLVANLHMLLCCLFWFHPLVWLLDRRLLAEREEACDETVLELTGVAEPYIRSLLKAVGMRLGWRLAGVSSARAANVRRRIERLRAGRPLPGASSLHRWLVAGVAVLLVAFTVAGGTSAWQGVPGCEKVEPPAEACPQERAEAGSATAKPECDGRSGPKVAVRPGSAASSPG